MQLITHEEKITIQDGEDYLTYRQGSGGTVEIWDINVISERRVGKGRMLVDTLSQELRGKTPLLFAITRNSNVIAQQFYEGIGFRIIGVLTRFYNDTDAIMYGKNL